MWSEEECLPAHHRQVGSLVQRRVWWPLCWQWAHWVRWLKRRRRPKREVVEKADRRGLFAMSCALGPVMEITIEEADFPSRRSLEVSQRGSCERMSPVLKVVSSSPIIRRGWEVGMPWKMRWVVGVSKSTEEVPGIR